MPQLLPSYYSGAQKQTWEFDTTTSCTTAGVPISSSVAYGGMQIDWGDGTSTTVASVDDYVHTYATAGQYHITVTYDDWANVELYDDYLLTGMLVSPFTEARASIYRIYQLPQVANTSFNYLFAYYTNLVELGENLFSKNSQAVSFDGTFYECSALSIVNDGIFANCKNAQTFTSLFENDKVLSVMPARPFEDCVSATSFVRTFGNLWSCNLVLDGMFDNCPLVTDFSYTFYGCGRCPDIPEGFFDNNLLVTSFYYTFWYCENYLTALPPYLFWKHKYVTNFRYTFDDCDKLANQTLYIGSEIVESAYDFFDATGDGHTVYVPAGTATETAFTTEANRTGDFTVLTY